MSKKHLAVTLSKILSFKTPKTSYEQYMTPSDPASEVVWDASLQNLIEDKVIADVCAGTGILGIAAALVGAKKIIFIEKDPDVIPLLKKNLESLQITNYDIVLADAKEVTFSADLALCNPPFGTKQKNIDSQILHNVLSQVNHCYSFHKTITLKHMASVVESAGAHICREFHFVFKLKPTMKQHTKKLHPVEVTCIHSTKGL